MRRASNDYYSESLKRTLSEAALLLITDWRGQLNEKSLKHPSRRPASDQKTDLLSAVHGDEEVFDFVRQIFNLLGLSNDSFTRALELKDLATRAPASLAAITKLALQVGEAASVAVPGSVTSLMKQRFRAHLSEIVVTTPTPQTVITETGISARGAAPVAQMLNDLQTKNASGDKNTSGDKNASGDIEFWGVNAEGPKAAFRMAERTAAFAALNGVTNLTLDVSQIIPSVGVWAVDSQKLKAHPALQKVAEACAMHDVTLTLTAHTYAQALTLPAIIKPILQNPEFSALKMGVVIFSEIPESQALLEEVLHLADSRAKGSAPVTVRVTTRSIRHTEMITALEHGLALPVLEDKFLRDSQALKLILRALSSDPAKNGYLSAVFECEDALLVALARVIATNIGASDRLTFQFRRGVATRLQQALAQQARVRVACPVVRKKDFADASKQALPLLADVVDANGTFAVNKEIFGDINAVTHKKLKTRASRLLDQLSASSGNNDEPVTLRLQNRKYEWEPGGAAETSFYRPPNETSVFETGGLTAAVLKLEGQESNEGSSHSHSKTHDVSKPRSVSNPFGVSNARSLSNPYGVSNFGATRFANEPVTDATNIGNRQWARSLMLNRSIGVSLNKPKLAKPALNSEEEHPALTPESSLNTDAWQALSEQQRAAVMRRAALAIAAARDRFFNELAKHLGLPPAEIDHQINQAIDSARYLASRTEELRAVRGAQFQPDSAIFIAASAETPFGDAAESLTAALATGAGVAIVIEGALSDPIAVLIEEWLAAGLPTGTVKQMRVEDDFATTVLTEIRDISFKRAILHCDAELVESIRRTRPDINRDVRSAGIGVVVVTETADQAQAVSQIVKSAFMVTAGNPRQTRAVIYTGRSKEKKKFIKKLIDASSHLTAADIRNDLSVDPLSVHVPPLVGRPDEMQLRALTELAPGESWALVPRQLNDSGDLWSPGIRVGVKPDAWFWEASKGVPVIGVTGANTLSEAIKIQNTIGSGAVTTLQSTAESEIIHWLAESHAANLCVNKSPTAAKIGRMPTGVWNEQQALAQPLAGGPNRLTTLGTWRIREGSQSATLHLRGLDAQVRSLIEVSQASLSYDSFDRVRRAALADALAWNTQFALAKDIVGLSTELNTLRYVPLAVHIRASEDAELESVVRVIAAAMLTRADFTFSTGRQMPPKIDFLLAQFGCRVLLESDETWVERAAQLGPSVSGNGESYVQRIRLIGGDAVRVSEWLSSHKDLSVWGGAVTIAGSVELFSFLREQAISVSVTRHGFAAPLPNVEAWLKEPPISLF